MPARASEMYTHTHTQSISPFLIWFDFIVNKVCVGVDAYKSDQRLGGHAVAI